MSKKAYKAGYKAGKHLYQTNYVLGKGFDTKELDEIAGFVDAMDERHYERIKELESRVESLQSSITSLTSMYRLLRDQCSPT